MPTALSEWWIRMLQICNAYGIGFVWYQVLQICNAYGIEREKYIIRYEVYNSNSGGGYGDVRECVRAGYETKEN